MFRFPGRDLRVCAHLRKSEFYLAVQSYLESAVLKLRSAERGEFDDSVIYSVHFTDVD